MLHVPPPQHLAPFGQLIHMEMRYRHCRRPRAVAATTMFHRHTMKTKNLHQWRHPVSFSTLKIRILSLKRRRNKSNNWNMWANLKRVRQEIYFEALEQANKHVHDLTDTKPTSANETCCVELSDYKFLYSWFC